MKTVLRRQVTMLLLIPRSPRRIGTTELRARLAERGFRATPRTIQRDLQALSAAFPIECHDTTKPYGWRWRADAPVLALPPVAPG